MNCPNCENYVMIEDFNNDEPFECESCHTLIQLVTDEGGYCGANDKRLIVFEED